MNEQIKELANQMAVLIDEATNLEISADWYHDSDPQYGGPPSVDQLMSCVRRLRVAYEKMALVTGLDPCEQLLSSRQLCKAGAHQP